MRTDKEINREIALLLRAYESRRWNQPTREKLEESIKVLTERMTTQQVEDRYYCDETAEEFEDGDNDLWAALHSVAAWLHGNNDVAKPSEGL
jgi:hypothetical protein